MGDVRLADGELHSSTRRVTHAPAGAGAHRLPRPEHHRAALRPRPRRVSSSGGTGFCIHPREVVASIPKVGGTKDVKVDRIRELAPTHVVVNVDENRLETVEELRAFVPSVVVTHPLGPLDNPPLYRLLGGTFGRRGRGGEALRSRSTRRTRRSPPRRLAVTAMSSTSSGAIPG